MLTAANVKIAELSKRVDRMEEEGKKYNVIIRGLRQQQKLERPLQLDALVLDFLTQQLGLEDAHFDEARRVQHDNAGSIKRAVFEKKAIAFHCVTPLYLLYRREIDCCKISKRPRKDPRLIGGSVLAEGWACQRVRGLHGSGKPCS